MTPLLIKQEINQILSLIYLISNFKTFFVGLLETIVGKVLNLLIIIFSYFIILLNIIVLHKFFIVFCFII